MSRDIEDLKKISSQVRRDILRMVHKVQSGHPGGSLGCTDLLVSLFFNIMKRKEDFDMNGKNEDIFFLSNGHISPVFYSVLSRAGYFDLNELNTFRELNSRLQGHPATHEGLPGIRIASGSLGQGLSVSIGSLIRLAALFVLILEIKIVSLVAEDPIISLIMWLPSGVL